MYHMKKHLLLLVIFATFATVVKPQTFEFVPDHTTITDTLGSELIFEFRLKNISASPQTIYILRPVDVLPHPDWTSSLCFDEGCFAPFVDSVATTVDFGSSPLQPGEERDFSVHIFTMTQDGSATVVVEAHNLANPAESYAHTLTGRTSPVSVEDEVLPGGFSLGQNFPNPFNPSTSVAFTLPQAGDVSLAIYDVTGKKVMEAATGYFEAGTHTLRVDASPLPSGVYMYRLVSGQYSATKKMILEK